MHPKALAVIGLFLILLMIIGVAATLAPTSGTQSVQKSPTKTATVIPTASVLPSQIAVTPAPAPSPPHPAPQKAPPTNPTAPVQKSPSPAKPLVSPASPAVNPNVLIQPFSDADPPSNQVCPTGKFQLHATYSCKEHLQRVMDDACERFNFKPLDKFNNTAGGNINFCEERILENYVE